MSRVRPNDTLPCPSCRCFLSACPREGTRSCLEILTPPRTISTARRNGCGCFLAQFNVGRNHGPIPIGRGHPRVVGCGTPRSGIGLHRARRRGAFCIHTAVAEKFDSQTACRRRPSTSRKLFGFNPSRWPAELDVKHPLPDDSTWWSPRRPCSKSWCTTVVTRYSDGDGVRAISDGVPPPPSWITLPPQRWSFEPRSLAHSS